MATAVNAESATEFFASLKQLPTDVKRQIISLLLETAGIRYDDYAFALPSDLAYSSVAAFNPNGKSMVVASHQRTLFELAKHQVHLIGLEKGGELLRFRAKKTILHVAFTRSGKVIVFSTATTLYLIDAASGETLREIRADGAIRGLSRDGRKYIVALTEQDLILHYTGVEPRDANYIPVCLVTWDYLIVAGDCYQFSPSGTWVYATQGSMIWCASSGHVLSTGRVLTVSPDNSCMATMYRNEGRLTILGETCFGSLLCRASRYLGLSIKRLEFSHDSRFVAFTCVGRDDEIEVMDVGLISKLFSIKGYCASFIFSGDIIAIHPDFTHVMLCDGITGNLLRSIPFSHSIRANIEMLSSISRSSTTIVSSPYADVFYASFEKLAPSQVISFRPLNCRSANANLRPSSEDVSWVYFKALYPLFFMQRLECSLVDSAKLKFENEVFINFRNVDEEPRLPSWPYILFYLFVCFVGCILYALIRFLPKLWNCCCCWCCDDEDEID
jgi:hypothetical protein